MKTALFQGRAEQDPVQHIGKYEVVREIGASKHGRIKVFEAVDRDLGRPVTLKLVADASDPRLAERFRREVALIAKLRVAHVIAVYELGDQEGRPFAAMQYLGEDNLAAVFDSDRALPLHQGLLVMDQVAAGVAEAHRAGLSHVGLQPGGIAIGPEGMAAIQDFGIVRLGSGKQNANKLYATPEQGGAAFVPDALCDVFVFGLICYEFLAGSHPFQDGEAGKEPVCDWRREPVPLRKLLPQCPEMLERLVSRSLEKRRHLRYQSFDEIRDDLRPILQALKRNWAAALWADSRRLIDSERLEEAQGLVREALQLDPDDPNGQQISSDLRALLQRRKTRGRLEELWRKADEAASNRRFFAAVDILESAVRLEEANAETRSRLEKMGARLGHSLEAAQLTREAQFLMNQGQWDQARIKALHALDRDAEDPEAMELMQSIVRAAESQDRLKKLISQAESLLSQQRCAEAVALLEPAAAEFSSDRTLLELLRRALESVERMRALEHTTARCNQLCQQHRFEQARELAERALADAPGEPALLALRQGIEAQAKSYRRAATVRESLEEVDWLIEQGRPDLAVCFLTQSFSGMSDDPDVAARLRQLQQGLPDWELRRLLETLQEFSSRRGSEGPVQGAVLLPVLQEALRTASPGLDVAATAERLQSCLHEEAIVAEVRHYLSATNTDQAEKVFQKGLEFLRGQDSAPSLRQEIEACREYAVQRRAAQVLVGQRRLGEAEQILLGLAGPNRPEIEDLLELVRALQAASDEKAFYARVKEIALTLAGQGKLDEADRAFRKLSALFPDDDTVEKDRMAARAGSRNGGQNEAGRTAESSEPPKARPAAEPWIRGVRVRTGRRRSTGRKLAVVATMLALTAAGAAVWRSARSPVSTPTHSQEVPGVAKAAPQSLSPETMVVSVPPAPQEAELSSRVVVSTRTSSVSQEKDTREVEPKATVQEAARQEAAKQAARLEVARQETARQEAARLDAAGQEAAQQEAATLDAARQEAARQEVARLDAARQEAARQEAARLDAAKQEAARQEAARQESARQEAVKLEAAREKANRLANEQGISRTLKAFQDAYTSMKLEDIKRLWSPMDPRTESETRNMFRHAKAFVYQLQCATPNLLTGESAVVGCDRTIAFTPKDGKSPLQAKEHVDVTVRREGSNWVIRDIVNR